MKECFVYCGAQCFCKDGLCLDSENGCRSHISDDKLDAFKLKAKELSNVFQIPEGQADCYMCNFEDAYICKEYNGGCKSIDECQAIYRNKR